MYHRNQYLHIYLFNNISIKNRFTTKKISWGLSHDKITTSNKLNNSQRGILVTL